MINANILNNIGINCESLGMVKCMNGDDRKHNSKNNSMDEKTCLSYDLLGTSIIVNTKTIRNAALIVLVNTLFIVLFIKFDVFEHIFVWSRRLEAWEIDEILLMLVGLIISLLWVSVQRLAKLKNALRVNAHHQRILLALSQVSLGVQHSQSPEEVLQITGEKITSIGYHAQIFMLSDDLEHIHQSYLSFDPSILKIIERSMGESIHDFRTSITPGGIFDQLISGEEAIFCDNIDEILPEVISQSRLIVSEVDIKQAVYAPLNSGGKANGILGILGSDLSEDDKHAVAIFAGQIALALEKTKLFSAALNEISIRKQSEAETLRHQEILTGINRVLSERLM